MGESTTRREFLRASAAGTVALAWPNLVRADATHRQVVSIERQPFAAQVRRLVAALDQVGAPLRPADQTALDEALALPSDSEAVSGAMQVLDAYALVTVTINPEGRVSAAGMPRGSPAELVEQGWRVFLLKVHNQGAVTAALSVASPQAAPVSVRLPGSGIPNGATVVAPETASRPAVNTISAADVAERWFDLEMFDDPPLTPTLSGLAIEYRIAALYSRDRGLREATIAFAAGPSGTDLVARSEVPVLFRCVPSRAVVLNVRDVDGTPTTAAFTVRDTLGRIYPLRNKRLAPDLFFQTHVYRSDGETITLPEGEYTVQVRRGPEYFASERRLSVGAGLTAQTERFQLTRWIDPSESRWYSGDHHIHAAGCSHFNTPAEGVDPSVIARHVRGEALWVGDVLSWGPSWYHQKQFFTGGVDPSSTHNSIIRYDVEVSGFPSSHSGHLVLLGLRDQDYPGTVRLEDWPSWSLPILLWAKGQGAVVGYAHTGHGLEVGTTEVPNLEIPPFNNNGANEYLIDVTHEVNGESVVDILSVADTSAPAELNLWYHALNCGFRTRIGGETDFPCLFGTVGTGRSYVQLDTPPTGEDGYRTWLAALKAGRAYVSDGRAHILDFSINETAVGVEGSELRLGAPTRVRATARVAAWLDEQPTLEADRIRQLPLSSGPWWHVERARIERSRTVSIEVIVNGLPIAQQVVDADGVMRSVTFDLEIATSSWVALRIFPAAHTNPVFVQIADRPIRASRASAEWCLRCIDRSWDRQSPRIDAAVRGEAAAAYDHARNSFRRLLTEA